MDCLDHCVALVDTSGPSWRLLYINTAWAKLTGAARDAAVGQPLEEVFEPAPAASQTAGSHVGLTRASEEFGADGLLTAARRAAIAEGREVVIRGVRLRPGYSSRSCSAGSTVGSACSGAQPAAAARRLILRLR